MTQDHRRRPEVPVDGPTTYACRLHNLRLILKPHFGFRICKPSETVTVVLVALHGLPVLPSRGGVRAKRMGL